MSQITALTDATFDETVQGSSEPVIVDFWAEWCGPCKMISPILEEIAADHEGTLRVAKLNVDDNPDITRRFDVMSIPTLIVFQDGQAKKRLVGAKGKGQLLQELRRIPVEGLPLRPGAAGESVRDLQRRLATAGFDPGGGEHGRFGAATETAVKAFQVARGLGADGVCDQQTWNAVVEAGYRLGDRLLYLRQPMQRGDDVAELQTRLGTLGFDPGRIDGIFGPTTMHALTEFQANTGLPPDGIAGPETVEALSRLGARSSTQGVSEVRERDSLRHAPTTLAGRRIAIGEPGGLELLVRGVHRALAIVGADVLVLQHPDGSTLAAAANTFAAELYVDLVFDDERCHTVYYAATGFESAGGKRLAEILESLVPPVLGQEPGAPVGMRLEVLRETRMPAVRSAIGPPRSAVTHLPDLALAVGRGITRWCQEPIQSA